MSTLVVKLPHPPTIADIDALPPHMKGEIIDGVFYAMTRPRGFHQSLAGAVQGELYGPFQRGRAGPGGWWILPEPGIEFPGSPEVSPDVAGWKRERMPAMPRKKSITVVPDWVCEVLSDSGFGVSVGMKLARNPGSRARPERTTEPYPGYGDRGREDESRFHRNSREFQPTRTPRPESDSTRRYDLRTKRPFYAREGVSWMWVVDPDAWLLTAYRNDNGQWAETGVWADEKNARIPPFGDVEIDVSEWWLGEEEADASE